MLKIISLDSATAEKYRSELAQLYFENARLNAYHSHYTYEEAFEKIGSLIAHLEDNTAVVYGAFDDEKVIGFIWAYPHRFREEQRMYISEIRVREEYRKQGIGSGFLKLVENRAADMGITAMYLHAEAASTDVRRLYESLGYIEERIQMRKGLDL